MNVNPIRAGLALSLAFGFAFGALVSGCNRRDATGRAGGGEGGSGAGTLRFSAIPDTDTTEQTQKFGILADYLAEELDVAVEFVPAADYDASVTRFANGEIQLAWFGGLTGVQARALVPGARAIAQGAEDPKFFSYFIAHADTGLVRSDEFPAAIGELKFTFGAKQSTSGCLMPSYFIMENSGMTPDEFFVHPVGYSGSHPMTAELVENGTWQAGALNYTEYDALVAEGTIDPATCRIIWQTPPYADYNFTAHPDLDRIFGAGFTDKLQAALIAIDDPAILDALKRSAIIAADNSDFEGIEKVARQLGMLR